MITTLDRSIAPPLKDIEELMVPKAERIKLDNGILLYTINSGKKEIVKLELSFKSGKWYEPENLVSTYCAKLMKEGTKSRSSKEIAEFLDFYGASLKISSNAELGTIVLYTLKKYLDNILPLINEILTEATFLENEFRIIRNNSKQNLLIQLEKNDFIATRKFLNVLYGSNHPLGYMTQTSDHEKVNLNTVKTFYHDYYTSENCTIIASGIIDERAVNSINKYLGNGLKKSEQRIEEPKFDLPVETDKIHFDKKEKSVQSAIRIGMRSINKTHKDHSKLTIVNTILGGYFSSRLMSNIREEKGYTYGIYSGLNSLIHDAHFSISTEVGTNFRDDTIKEIFKEINRLKEQTVPDDELEMVKNYKISKVLDSVDGPFNLSNTYKKLWLFGLDESYLYDYIQEIRSIDTNDIKELTEKYLKTSDLYQIAVG